MPKGNRVPVCVTYDPGFGPTYVIHVQYYPGGTESRHRADCCTSGKTATELEPAGTPLRKDPPGSWPSEERFPFGTK